MKDEAASIPIISFIGSRCKMYSYQMEGDKDTKKCKGITKDVVKKDIKHDDYHATLFGNRQMMHNMKTIRSNKHNIKTYEINKCSLSCFDNKRYILVIISF